MKVTSKLGDYLFRVESIENKTSWALQTNADLIVHPAGKDSKMMVLDTSCYKIVAPSGTGTNRRLHENQTEEKTTPFYQEVIPS
jgi:hypothetical protein